MNRSHLWKLLLIVGLIFWSMQQMFFPSYRWIPPKGRDLVQEFGDRAVKRDETFKQILNEAQALEKQRPDLAYEALQQAIGTNDIRRYFPMFNKATEKELKPTTYILNRLQRDAASPIKLGLDLQGGVSILVRLTNQVEYVTTNAAGILQTNISTEINPDALEQALDVLRKRVDRFGVAEPLLQPQGTDRILVQLPGLSHAQIQSAKETLQKVAFLEFRLVHRENDQHLRDNTVPPGYVKMFQTKVEKDGTKTLEPVIVQRRSVLKGGIKRAMIDRDTMGRPEIVFWLESDAAKTFADITTRHVGERLAILLDAELQTAPVIRQPIPNGNGTISGDYSEEEARTLRNVLENPLRTPVTIESLSEVDPTLGQDSIQSGVRATIIGVIAVVAFMLVYYLAAGTVANIALVLNVVILMGIMCSIGTTLTLPGIAGIVLTVGMAVDANVLIYERIREEFAAGKSMRGAIVAGYDKAFGTILDSNLTTVISSVILIFMGSGPVKGFGVTLTIGVAVSMFTALVVTRLIFDFLVAKNILKSLPMLHLIRATKINFMRYSVPAFAASWLLIIIGMSYGVGVRGGDVLGVEFVGGETVTLAFDRARKPEIGALGAVARKAAGEDIMLGYQRDAAGGTETLQVTTRTEGGEGTQKVADRVTTELREAFPDAGFREIGRTIVGPTVGEEIQRVAVVATLVALFGILVYVAFRYEFSFAVGAIVAIVHDVLMTLGWYFLSGRQLNATTVAAVLTIIGFSINDTIVIFDRIREDLKLGMRGSFRDIINQAVNQTLSRTIITSGTVFLATLSLYLFGGGVINDFAFTFLVGILTGSYSTIFIASAIVLWWHRGQRPKLGNAPMTAEAAAPAKA